MIRFPCPLCQGTVTASDNKAGLAVVCPSCHNPITAPVPTEVAKRLAVPERFACLSCGTRSKPERRDRISTWGWVCFVALLFFCLPLCWIGLLIRERGLFCVECGIRLGD